MLPIASPPSRRETTKKAACRCGRPATTLAVRVEFVNRAVKGLDRRQENVTGTACRAPPQKQRSTRGRNRDQAFFADAEFAVAPADFLGEEAGEPDGEGEGVAEGEHPEFAADERVAEAARAGAEGDFVAQQRVAADEEKCGGPGMRERNAEDGPRQRMGEEQAEMTAGAREADAEVPADLVMEC